jgi:hypothetical protein
LEFKSTPATKSSVSSATYRTIAGGRLHPPAVYTLPKESMRSAHRFRELNEKRMKIVRKFFARVRKLGERKP